MRCPICKEEIEDNAQKCWRCGSYIKLVRRGWAAFKSVLELLTFIAAIAVFYFVWQANKATQDQLSLQRKSVEYISKQFIEEKRPRLDVNPTKISLTATSMLLYYDVENTGVADAEDISIYFTFKYEDFPKDTLFIDSTTIPGITKDKSVTKTWLYPPPKRTNITCSIEVKYYWTIQSLNYTQKKYYLFYL